MKVLLLNPPFLTQYGKFSRSQRSPAITKAGTFYYPIWLAYATGVVEEDGFEVKLYDAPARRDTYEGTEKIVKDFAPDLLVVETSTPSFENDVKVAGNLKRACSKKPFVLLVGTHTTALPFDAFHIDPDIDAVTRGEYDYTVRDVARMIADGGVSYESLKSILGLTFSWNGKLESNPDRPWIEDVDSFPMLAAVYKKHLNVYDYFFGGAQYPMVMLVSGRGCKNMCSWCVWPQTITGRRWRDRSPENVVDELEFIAREMPEVKDIGFEDDTFAGDQKRVEKICDLIIERKLKISWWANVRANLKYETMVKMKQAGCRFLIVGFESGSNQILKNIRKGITVKMSRQFMQNARRAKLLVHGCFVAGNPGENRETLKQTLDLALELNPDTAQFFPMQIYPGTDAYRWAEQNGYITAKSFSDWITPTGLHNTVVSTPELSAREVVEWCDYARRRFYLRPKYIWYKFWQTLVNPTERGRNLKQFRNFYRYLLKGSFINSES